VLLVSIGQEVNWSGDDARQVGAGRDEPGGVVAAGNYYVQSPSHEGGYRSSSMQATPVYNSLNEPPSHPSYGRHSPSSSVSRFSGNLSKMDG
jgi:hypothetical protein